MGKPLGQLTAGPSTTGPKVQQMRMVGHVRQKDLDIPEATPIIQKKSAPALQVCSSALRHRTLGTRCTAPALIAATTTEPVSRPSSSLAPRVITARRGKPQSTVTVTNRPCGNTSVT